MKKLLIVSDTFLPRIDGVSKFLEGIIPHLMKHFEVTILTGAYSSNPLNLNYKVIRVPVYNIQLGDYKPTKKSPSLVNKLISENDFIWTHTLGFLGSYAIDSAKKNKKKCICFVHSIEWELFSKGLFRNKLLIKPIEKIAKHYVKKHYNKSSLLIVPSEEVKERLVTNQIKTKTKIIHLGIDTQKFSPPKNKNKAKEKIGINKDTIVIGYAGRIAKEKDIPTLISAFKKVHQEFSKTILLVIGKGNKHIEILLEEEGIKRTGAVENIVPFFQAMDIFVLPSLTETSSLSTMEAMSCEVPVICTPVGNIKEYVHNQNNGYLFSQGDIDGLSGYLRMLIRDEKLRKKIGENGRKTIIKKYLWKNTIKDIINILKKESS
jgi:1,2-diacylglycerol 3-alpha-glucosyltransferase